MHNYQKIGILGGIGQDSTGDFFLRVIALFQNFKTEWERALHKTFQE